MAFQYNFTKLNLSLTEKITIQFSVTYLQVSQVPQ